MSEQTEITWTTSRGVAASVAPGEDRSVPPGGDHDDHPVTLDRLRALGVRAASHHARTPLSLVTGALHTATREPGLSDATRRELAIASEHAGQLGSWIDQLTDIGTWPHEPSRQGVRLGVLLEDVGRNLLAGASWHGVTYTIDVSDDRDVQVDPQLASWMVRALVRHAIEAAGPRGHIALRSFDDPVADVVIISVEIEPDGSADAPSVTGDGDMRIVAGIVALHRGTLNRRIDGRSTTTLTTTLRLPGCEGPAADHGGRMRAPTGSETSPAQQDGHMCGDGCGALVDQDAETTGDAIRGPAGAPLVLLVEDDASLRSYLLRTLSVDYRIVALSTAEAAADDVERLSPDVIVCDLSFPGRDGEELVQDLHADHLLDPIPVIVLSGDNDEARRIRFLRGGADDYVVKPFTVDELRARIANLVQARLDLDELRDRASRTHQLAAQLQAALDSRVVIEQAKAFIAADRGVGVDEAFDVMRRHARSQHLKLHELAARVVDGFRP